MKRFLLLTALAITTLSVSAQERSVRMSPHGFSKSLDQASSAPAFKGLKPTANNMRSDSRATVCAAVIGTSTNAYGTVRSTSHCLSINQDLNTVVFVYRNDINEFPDNTSSQYRYAVSYSGGDTFTNDIGPINPAADGAVGGINARYPQGLIYNPSGNTTPQNAWMVYTGAWHNGASSNDTWDGLTNGVVRLNNDLGTITEHNDFMNDGDVTIPSSLVQGKPGEFWTIDQEYTGQVNDSLLIVYKGVWTGTDVSWSIFAKLNPGWVPVNDTTTSFNESISFSPDGKHGWIAGVAHFTQNLSPYLYYSSDSGATWTGPTVVDFSDPSLANLSVDLISPVIPNPPPTVAELDLVVDKNGDPHLAVMLTPGAELSTNFYPGLVKIYDLSYSITGDDWTATFVDTTSAYDGVIGVSSTGDHTQSNRLQSSITPHGEWVSMIWADTDPLSANDNSLPDLKGVAINVDQDTMTQVINFTSTDLDWAGVATQHLISPVSFYDATTHKINVPVVVTRINQNTGNADDAVTYLYIRNINFNEDNTPCNIIIGINDVAPIDSELTLSPNPSSDIITLQGMQFNNAVINVVNVLGEVLSTETVTASTYQINAAALPAGFYSVLVSDNGSTITKKFVVQH